MRLFVPVGYCHWNLPKTEAWICFSSKPDWRNTVAPPPRLADTLCMPAEFQNHGCKMPKNVTLFQYCTEKTLGQILDQQFFCTFLGVEPAVALAASASGSSQSWWIFIHQKMDATKMDATNQPLGVLSVFLGLFAFRPFFHLWELRFGRLRSQWDDWITRDFKHLQGGLYEHY